MCLLLRYEAYGFILPLHNFIHEWKNKIYVLDFSISNLFAFLSSSRPLNTPPRHISSNSKVPITKGKCNNLLFSYEMSSLFILLFFPRKSRDDVSKSSFYLTRIYFLSLINEHFWFRCFEGDLWIYGSINEFNWIFWVLKNKGQSWIGHNMLFFKITFFKKKSIYFKSIHSKNNLHFF